MTTDVRTMSEESETGRVLKSGESDLQQQPAAEQPADGQTGQPPPASQPPQTEGKPVEGILKTPYWVIEAIEANQRDAEWWVNHKRLDRLRGLSEKMIDALDLRAKDAEKLGVPLIKIEKRNVRTLGTYRPQADGYAIVGTIILNEERLETLEPFMEMALMLTLLIRARQHQLGGNGSLDREGRELMKAKGVIVTEKGKITIMQDGAFRRFLESEGFDLRLIAPASTVSEIPAVGKNLVIMADVGNTLHFRIFDGDGKVVVDTDEPSLTAQTEVVANLKRQLKGFNLWPPHELTGGEKGQVIAAVASIVGQHLPPRIEVPIASMFERPERKGKTTLQLWSCLCQKARVGTKEFFANCTICHEPFRLADHVGKRFVS
jgi:hypothetical protein